MSYQYSVNERRRRRQTRGTSPSFGQIRTGSSHQHNHSTLGYWVPLVITVGAAAVGIAAWIWSERRERDEDNGAGYGAGHGGGIGGPLPQPPPPGGYSSMSGGLQHGPAPGPVPVGASAAGTRPEDYPPPPPGMQQNFPPGPGPEGAGGPGGYQAGGPPLQGGFQGGPSQPPAQGGFKDVNEQHEEEDQSFVSRVSNVFGGGRSASPAQKTLDWAGKKVSAGVAAAGAMAGAAMKSMGMSGEDDAERWSEEADNRYIDRPEEPTPGLKRRGTADEFYSGAVDIPPGTSIKPRNRTTVAVVVSAADNSHTSVDLDHHTSVLAHLPKHINADTTRVLVLIYAPDLKVHPLQVRAVTAASQKVPSQSMASSFSNISQREAETPGEVPEQEGVLAEVAPHPLDQCSSLFKTLYNQAAAVVEAETNVVPYTTNNGHKHILKSLGPQVVYIQESLCGEQGEVVAELSGWVRQIVVVIGDDGTGGLVDTDDEESREKLETKWWTKEERTGLGKRVAVVDGVRIGDDWDRRLNDKE